MHLPHLPHDGALSHVTHHVQAPDRSPRNRPTRQPLPVLAAVRNTAPLHQQYMSVEAAQAAASFEVLSTTPQPVDNRRGTLSMTQYRALVLDSSYRPIEVVSWQKAICMDLFDKVELSALTKLCITMALTSPCTGGRPRVL